MLKRLFLYQSQLKANEVLEQTKILNRIETQIEQERECCIQLKSASDQTETQVKELRKKQQNIGSVLQEKQVRHG